MKIYAGPAELLDASGQTVAEIDVELYIHDTGSGSRGWGGPFELTRIVDDISETARIRLPEGSEAAASCQSHGWLQGSAEPPDVH